jgi:hypothetical protein
MQAPGFSRGVVDSDNNPRIASRRYGRGVKVSIGVIVPAQSIRERLEQQELADMREQEEVAFERRNLPKPD